jgi:diguanylate cyclase (GGDEF)-like protein/PAS domain S-box-containing protein
VKKQNPSLTIAEMDSLKKRIEDLEKIEAELMRKLRINDDYISKVLDALPINIFLEDPDGKTIFANEQACKANGKSKEELIGKTVYDFFPESIASDVRNGDLSVWENRRLTTREIKTGFQGKENYMFAGKTIIQLEESKEDFLLGFALDITDRIKAEQLLRESEEKFRSLVDQAADSFFLISPSGHIIDVNMTAIELLGYKKNELLKLTAEDLFIHLKDKITKRWKGNKSYRFEDFILTKEKEEVPADINVRQVKIGGQPYFLALCRDIRDKKQAEELMEHMAYHDALTGLPNRWYTQTWLEGRLVNSLSGKKPFGILLIDLDRFKVINDSLGHHAGDLLLQRVSVQLQEAIGKEKGNILARFGGDEFMILLPDAKSAKDAFVVCERIMEIMTEPYYIYDQKFNITASIGICLFPEDGQDVNTLIKNADMAMYRSKEQGRNCYSLFNPSMKEDAIERMDKEILLRKALDENEFVLHYQPKMDILTGKIQGMEALIRWKNDQGKILYPDSFIDIAEETGLIVPIGDWVIREACQECKRWQDAGLTDLSVSVNLSLQQFHKQNLEQLIASVLEETGLSASSLELELTESTVMKHPAQAAIVLNNLKSLGVSISIDDFGTGFSSLSYLKHFPIDTLKIDKSFIMNLEWDEANTAIASAVISLAQSLNLRVVAEGVETKEQLDFLRSKNCNLAQGYFISKPLESIKALSFVQDNIITV